LLHDYLGVPGNLRHQILHHRLHNDGVFRDHLLHDDLGVPGNLRHQILHHSIHNDGVFRGHLLHDYLGVPGNLRHQIIHHRIHNDGVFRDHLLHGDLGIHHQILHHEVVLMYIKYWLAIKFDDNCQQALTVFVTHISNTVQKQIDFEKSRHKKIEN